MIIDHNVLQIFDLLILCQVPTCAIYNLDYKEAAGRGHNNRRWDFLPQSDSTGSEPDLLANRKRNRCTCLRCGDAQNLHQMTSDDMESPPTHLALMDTDKSWICTTAIHWRVPAISAMRWNRNRSKSKRAIWSVGGVNVHTLDQGGALRSS